VNELRKGSDFRRDRIAPQEWFALSEAEHRDPKET
jgi:hypothetical protein